MSCCNNRSASPETDCVHIDSLLHAFTNIFDPLSDISIFKRVLDGLGEGASPHDSFASASTLELFCVLVKTVCSRKVSFDNAGENCIGSSFRCVLTD